MSNSLSVHFNPDGHHHIMSATKSEGLLLSEWCEYDEVKHDFVDDGPCLACVSRKLYFEAMTGWLDRKAHYNDGGEFAGAGYVSLQNLKLLPEGAYLSASILGRRPNNDDVPVREYRATAFEVQMEHG